MRNTVIVGLTILTLCILASCEREYPSIWNPNQEFRPNPIITSVEPPEGTFAVIGTVTVKGENFSPVKDENYIYFDGERGTILTANDTLLTANPPNIAGDSIRIKLRVEGALLYAEYYPYKLMYAAEEYGGFGDYDDCYGLACDTNENLYVSVRSRKVIMVTPDGEQHEYATTSFEKASAMRMGPEGYIYYVNILPYVFRILPGGGSDELFVVLPGGVYDLDFDQYGNLYCGGNGQAIYRVKLDRSYELAADYSGIDIKAVRVFNGYLYVGGDSSDHKCIWRNQIVSEDSLSVRELYFDWSSYFGTYDILSITFDTDGNMYVGTDAPDAIIIIRPDKTYTPLYPGVLEPQSYSLCWGNKEYLYVNRRSDDPSKKRIIRVNMLDKRGAPYYGRQL